MNWHSICKSNTMKNIILSIISIFIISISYAIKPTEITLSSTGQISSLYFNLENSETPLLPLAAIKITGQLKTKAILLNFNNEYFWLDENGNILTPNIVTNLKFGYNFDNKLEKIKDNSNTLLYKLVYDFNGRLVQIKDGNYNLKFKLHYDFDGNITAIANNNYEKLIRFNKDFNNSITTIKDKDYNYEYKFYYNFDNQLEKIKDANYNILAKVVYTNGIVTQVSKSNLNCTIIIENAPIQNLNSQNYPFQQQNSIITIYDHANYEGKNKNFTIGNYATLGFDWNNMIASIALPSNIKIIVYDEENFAGNAAVITSNWSISNWNDTWAKKISSFQIMYK